MQTIESLLSTAARHGLLLRGGFVVNTDDSAPDVDGQPAKHVLLFGNAGSTMWEVFRRSAEYRELEYHEHPLNRWSARIGEELARRFSARAVFPFGGPPHWPFLRWGKKAEALENSQLGMLMHPRFGLWHAYRFALVFARELTMETQTPVGETETVSKSTCGQCATKPCLPACPVGAFGNDGYNVQVCYRYLAAHPDSKCMTQGCQARAACPHGVEYRYAPPHAAFHMRAFVAALAGQPPDAEPHELKI